MEPIKGHGAGHTAGPRPRNPDARAFALKRYLISCFYTCHSLHTSHQVNYALVQTLFRHQVA